MLVALRRSLNSVERKITVIGCWLKRHGMIDLEELWKTNPKSRYRLESPETDEQRAFIESWIELEKGGSSLDPAMVSRAQKALLGQVAGDSLGSLVEFRSVADILRQYPTGARNQAAGETFNILAGQPTDDLEMALLLARSLVSKGMYDAEAVKARFILECQLLGARRRDPVCIVPGQRNTARRRQ